MHGDQSRLGDVRTASDEGLVRSRPPPQHSVVATWHLHAFAEVSVLRHELLHYVTPTGANVPAVSLGAVADNMVLVASKLASNALRHGRPPTVVTLSRHENSMVLDVADHDPSTVSVVAGQREPAFPGGRVVSDAADHARLGNVRSARLTQPS